MPRWLRVGIDGDPGGLPTRRSVGGGQRPVPYEQADMVESCWESEVDLRPACMRPLTPFA
jgi:hypothetical protein